MSRNIEEGQVLSQEDYDWLAARMRVEEALNQWGCKLGEGVGPDGDAKTHTPIAVNFADTAAAGPAPAVSPGALQSVHPDQVKFIEGSVLEDDEDSETEDDEVPPYSEWLKADLLAEVSRRNADRSDEDQIKPVSEKNADLVNALEADDEANPDDDTNPDG